jgi:hydroxyacylglutathione hydrolase
MTTPLDKVKWIHGAPDCALSTDPLIQVHPFDDDSFILRLSKCYSFEGNFIYLLFGDTRAVVFDTGGPPDQGEVLTIRQTIDNIIDGWVKKRRLDGIDLVVAHTHSHGDHDFWDGQVRRPPAHHHREAPAIQCGGLLWPARLAERRGDVGAGQPRPGNLPDPRQRDLAHCRL